MSIPSIGPSDFRPEDYNVSSSQETPPPPEISLAGFTNAMYLFNDAFSELCDLVDNPDAAHKTNDEIIGLMKQIVSGYDDMKAIVKHFATGEADDGRLLYEIPQPGESWKQNVNRPGQYLVMYFDELFYHCTISFGKTDPGAPGQKDIPDPGSVYPGTWEGPNSILTGIYHCQAIINDGPAYLNNHPIKSDPDIQRFFNGGDLAFLHLVFVTKLSNEYPDLDKEHITNSQLVPNFIQSVLLSQAEQAFNTQ